MSLRVFSRILFSTQFGSVPVHHRYKKLQLCRTRSLIFSISFFCFILIDIDNSIRKNGIFDQKPHIGTVVVVFILRCRHPPLGAISHHNTYSQNS